MGDVLKWGKIQGEMSCSGAYYSYRKFYDVTVPRMLIKVNGTLACLPSRTAQSTTGGGGVPDADDAINAHRKFSLLDNLGIK